MAKEYAIIVFKNEKTHMETDVETPLDITANEFVLAMNSAFALGIEISDITKCYLKSENPFALLKGNRKLEDFGVRNGTVVYYTE